MKYKGKDAIAALSIEMPVRYRHTSDFIYTEGIVANIYIDKNYCDIVHWEDGKRSKICIVTPIFNETFEFDNSDGFNSIAYGSQCAARNTIPRDASSVQRHLQSGAEEAFRRYSEILERAGRS